MIPEVHKFDKKEYEFFREYEVRGTWWTQWTVFEWMSDLGAWYINKKVLRKYQRYLLSINYMLMKQNENISN